MPGFAPLAAVPLASVGLPPAYEAVFAGVFALGAAAQGRSQADAVASGAVVLAGQAQGKISTQAHAHAAGDTGAVTLAGQSRGTVIPQAYVDSVVSISGVARATALTAAANVARITVDGSARAELADTGRVTGDYVARGQAAVETGTTAIADVALALNLVLAASPSNEGHATGALPFTAGQNARSAISARATVLWQAGCIVQGAIPVQGRATQLLPLDGISHSDAWARATGAGSMALAGTARLAGFTSLRAQGGIALAGQGNTSLGTQGTALQSLTLTGQAGGIAQQDRFATSTSDTSLSGDAKAQATLVSRTSGHITLRVETTANTAVLGYGRSGIEFARMFDAAAQVDAAMARAIIFAGVSAALTASVTRKTITAPLLLSGSAQVRDGIDVAAATPVPLGVACAGQVGLSLNADLRLRLPSVSTASTGLSGTATKTVVLAGIASAAPRTFAQVVRTPLALTGIAQATPGLAATSDGKLALTRLSRTSAQIDASAGPALHLQLQTAVVVPLRAFGHMALPLQGAAWLPIRITAIARGRLDHVGAGQSAVAMRATAGASFDLDAVAGAKVAARGQALDRVTVTRTGAGDLAVVGDAARIITVTGQSVLRVNSRALAQPVLAPNLQATGASGLQGKLSGQAVRPDGAGQASMTVDAAFRYGSWPLTLLAFGVRAPPGQRRFTPPDTAQGGSVIAVPRSGVLRAEPRTGRILKG